MKKKVDVITELIDGKHKAFKVTNEYAEDGITVINSIKEPMEGEVTFRNGVTIISSVSKETTPEQEKKIYSDCINITINSMIRRGLLGG